MGKIRRHATAESRRPLRICTISKGTFPWPPSKAERDLRVQAAIADAVGAETHYLLVQSGGIRFRTARADHVVGVYIPFLKSDVINHIWFIIAATACGLWLRVFLGVNLFLVSDATGGGVAGVLIQTLGRVPMLVQLQGSLLDLPPEVGRFRRWYARRVTLFVCSRADSIRCVSDSIMQQAVRAGINPQKLRVVPSRCDTEQFRRARHANGARQIRRRWNLRPTDKVLLYVGALSIHKGVTYLVRALQEVLRAHPEVVCLIVGSGNREMELRTEVEILGLAERVRFCGQAPYWEIPAHMAAADVFVLPSLDEGMPRVVLEAMSMELPIVASAVGGVPELVTNAQTGLLVPPGDYLELARALEQVFDDPEMARRWGRRGRLVVEASFSFEAGVQRLAALISELA